MLNERTLLSVMVTLKTYSLSLAAITAFSLNTIILKLYSFGVGAIFVIATLTDVLWIFY